MALGRWGDKCWNFFFRISGRIGPFYTHYMYTFEFLFIYFVRPLCPLVPFKILYLVPDFHPQVKAPHNLAGHRVVFSAPCHSLARETIRRTSGGQLRSRLGVNDILDIILTQVMSRTDDRVRMSDDPRNRNVDNTQENRCKSRLSHFIKPFFIRTLHFNDRNRSVTYKNKLGYTLKKLNGHFLFLFLYISL